MQHTQLAWALVAVSEEHLTASERFDIYLALGAGDDDAAVPSLLRIAVRNRIALPRDVVAGLHNWVEAHCDADPELHALLALVGTAADPDALVAVNPARYLPISGRYAARRRPPSIG